MLSLYHQIVRFMNMQIFCTELFVWIRIEKMDVDGYIKVQDVTDRPKQVYIDASYHQKQEDRCAHETESQIEVSLQPVAPKD